jgi:hypothetical protein
MSTDAHAATTDGARVARMRLVRENFDSEYCNTFVCVYLLVSHHRLIDLKDSSRDFLSNCVINFFYLYLMFYACVQIFDVTENLKIF